VKKNILAFLAGLALLPVAAILIASFGLWPTKATAPGPPGWERLWAQSALRSSLEREARGVTNPVTVSNETLLAGMKIYRTNCAGCHGESGHPSHWGTTGFYPRVPQFADVPSRLSASEMFLIVKHGIRYTGMGAWDGMLTDDEIWKTVTFLSHLQSLPEPVTAVWQARHE